MVLLFYALWLVQKTRAILWANQIQNQNQSPLRHTRFPALWAVCLLWLRILIGPLCNFPFRWLAAVIILVFVLWHPIEKGSKPVTCLLMLTTGLKLPAHTTVIIFTLTIGSLILKLESKFDGKTRSSSLLPQFHLTVVASFASMGTTPWSVMTARFSSSFAMLAMAAQTLAKTCKGEIKN